MGLYISEQTVQLCVNLVCDMGEVLRAVFVIKIFCLNDEDFAFIVGDPLLVTVVKIAEILDADAFFIFASAFLDLSHQSRD